MRTPTEARFVTPDGLNLLAEVAGPSDTATVVLLHGGGQTRHSWSAARDKLVECGYQVISYDARGHGQSDWSPNGDYSINTLATDLDAILSHIHTPMALVGASMGGLTAFYALGTKSYLTVKALVMVDIVLRPAPEGAERIRKFMSSHRGGFENINEVADVLSAFNPRRKRSKDFNGLYKNLRLQSDGRLYWHWDPRLLDESLSGAVERADTLRKISGKVTIPVLIVRGSESEIVDEEGLAETESLVPHVEILEVAGAGHTVVGDKNDDFNNGVVSFLMRHLPAG